MRVANEKLLVLGKTPLGIRQDKKEEGRKSRTKKRRRKMKKKKKKNHVRTGLRMAARPTGVVPAVRPASERMVKETQLSSRKNYKCQVSFKYRFQWAN